MHAKLIGEFRLARGSATVLEVGGIILRAERAENFF